MLHPALLLVRMPWPETVDKFAFHCSSPSTQHHRVVTCCMLMRLLRPCRLARVIALRQPPADDSAHRAWWRAQTGWELPEGRMTWLEVSFSSEEEEDDAATASVPACCAWSASGLSLQPARGAACAAVLSRLAGVK